MITICLGWWSDIRMVKELVLCAKHDGNPLFRLSESMKWGISFSPFEISELEKFLHICGPLETLFSSLDSDQKSTIQKVYPSIQVEPLEFLS